MVFHLIVALSLPLYLLLVGVAAAPVPQLLLAPVVPVLPLCSFSVLAALLRFQDLFHHRYHSHRYQPGGLVLHLLLLLARHLLVVAPSKLELSLRWL